MKLDTGMHRLGFVDSEIEHVINYLQDNPQLKIASVFSHLAAAGDPEERDFTLSQIKLFEKLSEMFLKAFNYPINRHILNTRGILFYPEYQFDMIRLGIGMFGITGTDRSQIDLRKVHTLKSVITQIKTLEAGETVGYDRVGRLEKRSIIATVALGYADGVMRNLSDGRYGFLIRGKIAPIIGKVCMDMTMVDVSSIDGVSEGDPVIVFGEDHSIEEMAKCAGTSPYEILTSISPRVKRVFIQE